MKIWGQNKRDAVSYYVQKSAQKYIDCEKDVKERILWKCFFIRLRSLVFI